MPAPLTNGTMADGGGLCVDLVSPHTPRGVALNNLVRQGGGGRAGGGGHGSRLTRRARARAQVVAAPSLAVLAFLASTARPSLRRLRSARSHMLWAYYGACWGVGGLALLRAGLLTRGGAAGGGPHAAALDAAWLATRLGTTTLEVSAVAVLLQGVSTSGAAALARAAAAGAAVAAVDGAVQAALIYGRHVPLFLWGGGGGADLGGAKWGYWLARSAAAAAAYAGILALPRTRWRAALPARRSFFRYAAGLAAVHSAAAAGAALLLARARFGYCLSGAATAAYFGLAPAAVYAAFLADFFRDASLDADLAYYSEMRDAGYLSEGGFSDGF